MISLPTCKSSALLPGTEKMGSNGAEDGQLQLDGPSIFGHVDSLFSLRKPRFEDVRLKNDALVHHVFQGSHPFDGILMTA